MVAWSEELQTRYPPAPDPNQGVATRCCAPARASCVPDVPDELLDESAAKDEEHLRLHPACSSCAAALSCPLKVRDRVLGVITWASGGRRGRRFRRRRPRLRRGPRPPCRGRDRQRPAAHPGARRGARAAAGGAARASCPSRPAGAAACATCRPGEPMPVVTSTTWCRSTDGRVAMFVGDVMGRGVQAASVMAQMRSAIRTLDRGRPDPGSCAERDGPGLRDPARSSSSSPWSTRWPTRGWTRWRS